MLLFAEIFALRAKSDNTVREDANATEAVFVELLHHILKTMGTRKGKYVAAKMFPVFAKSTVFAEVKPVSSLNTINALLVQSFACAMNIEDVTADEDIEIKPFFNAVGEDKVLCECLQMLGCLLFGMREDPVRFRCIVFGSVYANIL